MSDFVSDKRLLPKQSPFRQQDGHSAVGSGPDSGHERRAEDGAAVGLAEAIGGRGDPAAALCLFGGMFDGNPTSQTMEAPPANGSGELPHPGLFDWLMDGPEPALANKPVRHPAKAPHPGPKKAAKPGPSPVSAPTPSPAPIPAPLPANNQAQGGQAAQQDGDARINEAVAQSQDRLTKHGLFDSVTPQEAGQALHALTTLPPELQGKAIEKMSPETFGKMLSTVPPAQREQFKTLLDNTQDPERKLRLFAEYHKSKVQNDAGKEKEKTADEGHWWSSNDQQKENQRKNAARDQIVADTRNEVDSEIPFLLEKAKSGKLSAAEIQKYMDNKATEHADEMKTLKNHIGTMEGLSDEDRLKYTQNRVEQKLESGLFNPVTDGEARIALQTVKTLPPDLQGKLVEKLEKGSFDRLLENVPAAEQEQFDTLLKNTHDPERKLKLWSKYHLAKVKSDASKKKEQTADEGHLWSRDSKQEENKRLNDRRDEIVSSTSNEIDDESAYLMEKQKKGTLSEADVDALMQRKDHEHQLEMKYNVNLVNNKGKRQDGTKIAWMDNELTEVESGLARMPMSHVKGNKLLKEIRRANISEKEKDPANPIIGGDHLGGVIRVFDGGVTDRYRHTGDTRQLADPTIVPAAGADISPLEEVIAHEIGHDIHDQHPAAFKKFQEAAGWESGLNSRELKKKGLKQGEIDRLERGEQVKDTDERRRYTLDPYNHGPFGGARFLAADEGAIPARTGSPASSPARSACTLDTWDYARSNPRDHFAEHFQKAIHTPEKLAHDLLDAPQKLIEEQIGKRDAERAKLDVLKTRDPKPSEIEIKEQEKALAVEQRRLDAGIGNQQAKRRQFDIMRNDVFHTDQATATALEKLRGKGVPPDRLQEFMQKAGRASTPEQVELLATGY